MRWFLNVRAVSYLFASIAVPQAALADTFSDLCGLGNASDNRTGAVVQIGNCYTPLYGGKSKATSMGYLVLGRTAETDTCLGESWLVLKGREASILKSIERRVTNAQKREGIYNASEQPRFARTESVLSIYVGVLKDVDEVAALTIYARDLGKNRVALSCSIFE